MSSIKWTQWVAFRNRYVYINTYTHATIIEKKKPWIWNATGRHLWEGLEAGKRWEKVVVKMQYQRLTTSNFFFSHGSISSFITQDLQQLCRNWNMCSICLLEPNISSSINFYANVMF